MPSRIKSRATESFLIIFKPKFSVQVASESRAENRNHSRKQEQDKENTFKKQKKNSERKAVK